METKKINEKLLALISEAEAPLDVQTYRKIAKEFQSLAEKCVRDIWQKHNGVIDMKLNGIPFCLPGSAVNTSTAIGFLVEEFIVRQLPDFFSAGEEATINSAYDFKHNASGDVELMVNLKVEKNSSNNSGIVAGNILVSAYSKNQKPKLYLILKSKYRIDEAKSQLVFQGVTSYFLESFITSPGGLRSDSRNWSKSEFKILSGRLQLPARTLLDESGISTIPSPSKILDFIKELAQNLSRAKEK